MPFDGAANTTEIAGGEVCRCYPEAALPCVPERPAQTFVTGDVQEADIGIVSRFRVLCGGSMTIRSTYTRTSEMIR